MADTLTGTVDQADAMVGVTLSWTSAPVPATATIQRVNIGDGTVSAIRNADPATLVAGGWVGQDFEAPLDQSFYYRATSTDRPGQVITSALYRMASNGQTWLKHPGKPALNMQVIVQQGPDWDRPISQGLFDVIGRARPVAVTVRRSSERGDLLVFTQTEAERVGLLALLEDGSPLFLSTPDGYGVGNVYVAVGEAKETRLSVIGHESARTFTLPVTVVDRPSGAALATNNTWGDVLSTYATWSDFLDGEQIWANPLDGVGT